MASVKLRVTGPTLKILSALLATPNEISGAQIARITGLASGTLYPILMRLETARWVDSKWEDADPSELGRPRRRLYRVTALGARRAREVIEEVRADLGRLTWAHS